MPVTVYARKGEDDKSLFNRFKKAVSNDGLLTEMRKRRWFVSKSEQRRLAKKKAIRRIQRKKKLGKKRYS